MGGKETVEAARSSKYEKLWFSIGVPNKHTICNEYIRETLQVNRFGQKVRQSRLRRYGHDKRRYHDNVDRQVLEMQL